MKKLADTLTSFKPPEHTREEWDAINARADSEWGAECERVRRADHLRRIESCRIPSEFEHADLSECDARVREWSANPHGKGLLLQGEPGRGKTHAACAVLRSMIERGRSGRFVSMDDVLRRIKASFKGSESEKAIIGEYAGAGVLCIDDVGKERLTEWSLPIFFAIIDKRYASGKPTIITTNYQGAKLLEKFTVNGDEEAARALASRFAGYERVVLEGPDLRLDKNRR